MGGVTVGYMIFKQMMMQLNGTDYDARHYGVSFAVNDDLTVSYDKSYLINQTHTVDERY